MTFTLPWPPSVNTYWRHNRGRTHISHEGRAYREAVQWLFRGEGKPTGRMHVVIEAHPPDNRRRDLDNVLKATLDSLQHAGAYEDDSQIDYLLIKRGAPHPEGSLVVHLWDVAINTPIDWQRP